MHTLQWLADYFIRLNFKKVIKMQEFLADMVSFFKTIIPVRLEIEWGACFATVGTICSHLFGSWSNLWEAILLLMVLDYITGLLSAWINPNKKLDSRKGWRGLAKKAVIVIIIMVAHTADYCFQSRNYHARYRHNVLHRKRGPKYIRKCYKLWCTSSN